MTINSNTKREKFYLFTYVIVKCISQYVLI